MVKEDGGGKKGEEKEENRENKISAISSRQCDKNFLSYHVCMSRVDATITSGYVWTSSFKKPHT